MSKIITYGRVTLRVTFIQCNSFIVISSLVVFTLFLTLFNQRMFLFDDLSNIIVIYSHSFDHLFGGYIYLYCKQSKEHLILIVASFLVII